MLLMDDVVDGIDVEVVDVMDVQELLVVVERCLEGTEEVTNPDDVGYYVDDDHHSFDGVMDMPLVCDALSNHDEEVDDVSLDELLGLDDEVQSPLLDDFLLVQQDEYCLLHVLMSLLILTMLMIQCLYSYFLMALIPLMLSLSFTKGIDDVSQPCCKCQSPNC